MKSIQYLILLSVAFFTFSCSAGGPEFTVEGVISDADSSVLYLEKRELNQITILDSVRLNSEGKFRFKELSTPYPEFYVLRMNGEVINFAMDSTETVNIKSSKNGFATTYEVEGSLANQQIKTVVLAQYQASRQINDIQQKFSKKEINEEEYIAAINEIVNSYKQTAQKVIFANPKSAAAYFALFQKVNGLLYFDPYDKVDYKTFAAVATSWDAYYKNSPRSPHIRDYTLLAMKTRKQNEVDISENVKELDTSDYYNIDLKDVNGQSKQLSSLKGKVVLVDMTVYQSENSPAHNIALNKVYNKFKPNLEIYQVSFDSDKHVWRNAAINLPWIAVHDEKSVNSELIFKYNIQAFPTLFLLDRDGEIVKRLLPTDNIESEIQKIM